MKRQVPKEAIDFLARKRKEWAKTLPLEVKEGLVSHWQLGRMKTKFLRSGVPWDFQRPSIPSWTYFMPLRGRKTDRQPRVKAARIAEAMAAMPDHICQYREELRQAWVQQRAERRIEEERERLIEASALRITDMRALVDKYDAVDDVWMDANDDYYSLAYANDDDAKDDDTNTYSTKQQTEMAVDCSTEKNAEEKENEEENECLLTRQNEVIDFRVPDARLRVEARKKLRAVLKNKPLLAEELEVSEESEAKAKRSRESEDPTTGGWDDGRTWERRRSMDEQAFIQQLANEPALPDDIQKPPA